MAIERATNKTHLKERLRHRRRLKSQRHEDDVNGVDQDHEVVKRHQPQRRRKVRRSKNEEDIYSENDTTDNDDGSHKQIRRRRSKIQYTGDDLDDDQEEVKIRVSSRRRSNKSSHRRHKLNVKGVDNDQTQDVTGILKHPPRQRRHQQVSNGLDISKEVVSRPRSSRKSKVSDIEIEKISVRKPRSNRNPGKNLAEKGPSGNSNLLSNSSQSLNVINILAKKRRAIRKKRRAVSKKKAAPNIVLDSGSVVTL